MKNGYIALTSAIIISILIMAITLTLSSISFSNRFDILGVEFKKVSRALAEACLETALLKLSQNSSYVGNENILIDNKQCSIFIIESLSGQKIIKAKANFKNFITNLKVVANVPDISIISWEELANF